MPRKKSSNPDEILTHFVRTRVTEKVYKRLDGLYSRLKKHEDDHGLVAYRKYVGDFLFFLNSGVVPAGIGKNGLRIFLPILENLVQKGQLKPEVLDLVK